MRLASSSAGFASPARRPWIPPLHHPGPRLAAAPWHLRINRVKTRAISVNRIQKKGRAPPRRPPPFKPQTGAAIYAVGSATPASSGSRSVRPTQVSSRAPRTAASLSSTPRPSRRGTWHQTASSLSDGARAKREQRLCLCAPPAAPRSQSDRRGSTMTASTAPPARRRRSRPHAFSTAPLSRTRL